MLCAGRLVHIDPLAFKRKGAGAVACGGKLYVLGGESNKESCCVTWTNEGGRLVAPTSVPDTQALNKVEILDPQYGGGWQRGPSMLFKRAYPGVAAIDDLDDHPKLYVFGGENESGVLDSIECFDPEAGTWSVAGTMKEARRAPAVAVLEGKAFICGGGAKRSADIASVETFDPRAIERAAREAAEEAERVQLEQEKAARKAKRDADKAARMAMQRSM
jgi:hypothetical protein